MKKMFRVFLCVMLIIAASLQTYAQGFIYDQHSTNSPSIFGDYLNIQTEPLTQSFIPSLSAIGFVQLEFWDIPNNGNNGATVYVNLWTSSPNISSATFISSTTPVYMPDGFGGLNPGVTNFYFSSPTVLTTGQTYYLQPVVQSGDNPWDIWAPGNTYPNGQLFASGAGFNSDLWFREGVLATPEPTALSLAVLGGILALALKRRFKLCVLLCAGTFLFSFVYSETNSDSVVQVTADIAGLSPVTAAELPSVGTFFVLQPGLNGQLVTMPFPFLPTSYSLLPIYQVTGDTFLVDDTGGRLMAPSALNRNTAPPAIAAQAQMQSMSNHCPDTVRHQRRQANNLGYAKLDLLIWDKGRKTKLFVSKKQCSIKITKIICVARLRSCSKTANFQRRDSAQARANWRGLEHFSKGASRCLEQGATSSRLFVS